MNNDAGDNEEKHFGGGKCTWGKTLTECREAENERRRERERGEE